MTCVSVVLVVSVVVMAVRSIVLLMLTRKTPLHTLIHRCTFQSLFWHLSLVVQSLVRQLLLHLVCLVLPLSAHHVSPWWSACVILLRPHIKIVCSVSLGLIVSRRISSIVRWPHIVLLAEAFDLCQDAKATLRRNEAWYYFLCHILCRCSQQVLELDGTELLNYCALFANTLVETLLELVQLSFFFVKVLYESSPSFLHFVQSTL